MLDTHVSSNLTEPTFGLPEASLSTAVLLGVPELNMNANKTSAAEYGGDIVDLMLDSCFQGTAEFSGRKEDEGMDEFCPSREFDHYNACTELFKDGLDSHRGDSSLSIGDESSRDGAAVSSLQVFETAHSKEFTLYTGSVNPANRQSESNSSSVFGNRLRPQPALARNRDRPSRRKSKRAPAKPWSKEEHEKFEEALEMFGRNWGECARYIGTRPAPLVRSHAQKYLIKLWKTGKPLPQKVAESGKGYTLSGKPLHPDSASARSYLTKIPCPQAAGRK